MSYRIENGHLVREVDLPDGGRHIEMVPLAAFASRMALLGLDDPGAALDAIRAEQDLGDTNPYARVYAELFNGNAEPVTEQQQALSEMPIQAGCDDRETAEIKDLISEQFGEQLQESRQAFIQAQLPPKPSEEN